MTNNEAPISISRDVVNVMAGSEWSMGQLCSERLGTIAASVSDSSLRDYLEFFMILAVANCLPGTIYNEVK